MQAQHSLVVAVSPKYNIVGKDCALLDHLACHIHTLPVKLQTRPWYMNIHMHNIQRLNVIMKTPDVFVLIYFIMNLHLFAKTMGYRLAKTDFAGRI